MAEEINRSSRCQVSCGRLDKRNVEVGKINMRTQNELEGGESAYKKIRKN